MEDSNKEEKTIVIVKQKSNGFGIVSFIFGLISIFIFSPIFVPLAWLFGVIGLIKKQIVWSILGIVCAIIGFVTSPILMGVLTNLLVVGGLATLGASLESDTKQETINTFSSEKRSDHKFERRKDFIDSNSYFSLEKKDQHPVRLQQSNSSQIADSERQELEQLRVEKANSERQELEQLRAEKANAAWEKEDSKKEFDSVLADETLCSNSDDIVLSCNIKQKILSVCHQKDDKFVYKYGKLHNVELTISARPLYSHEQFVRANVESRLRFHNKGYDYIVYSNDLFTYDNHPNDGIGVYKAGHGVYVVKNNKLLANLKCTKTYPDMEDIYKFRESLRHEKYSFFTDTERQELEHLRAEKDKAVRKKEVISEPVIQSQTSNSKSFQRARADNRGNDPEVYHGKISQTDHHSARKQKTYDHNISQVISNKEVVDRNIAKATVSTRFLIALSTKSYSEAKAFAKKLSSKTSIPLKFRGLYYNSKLGLSLSKSACNDIDFEYPCYEARGRYDDGTYISIEYSNAYENFKNGYYIVVVSSGKESQNTLRKIKRIVKDAYIKRSNIYMECMH